MAGLILARSEARRARAGVGDSHRPVMRRASEATRRAGMEETKIHDLQLRGSRRCSSQLAPM